MSAIVVYKTKYGSTKQYAEWIAEDLGCDVVDTKNVKVDDLLGYDTIIYGGGLYAEVINGVSLITKNTEKLKDKKIEILAVKSVINENGYAVETLEPICPPVWAYFRHLSGREYHAANAEHMQEEVLFTINWRSDVTTAHVIRFGGVL